MPFPRLRLTPTHTIRIIHSSLTTTSSRGSIGRFYATQGYGDGKGDPKAEDPQNQPASNRIKHEAEHPGPDPPAVGRGSGGGPTKGAGKSSGSGSGSGSKKTPEDASAESGGARSKEAMETGGSPTGGKIGGGGEGGGKGKGARPMIHDNSTPNAGDKQAEVEQHNKEFEQRHDRAPPAQDDKVDKKFWEGHGGKDRNP